VSTLYRCKARVAYKPFNSQKLIVFEERQVSDINIKLNWKSNLGSQNAEDATGSYPELNNSTCQITINDPYLSGIAWPAVYDMAALYFGSNVAAANNVLLRSCQEGENPVTHKCYRYEDIDSSSAYSTGDKGSNAVPLIADYAHIIISLWYDVGGINFGTDFYFRLSSFSVSHGNDFPIVTLAGKNPAAIVFNQTPVNRSIPEGTTVEEALKTIFEESNYGVSFCNKGDKEPFVIPRAQRWKGLTDYELAIKQLNATGGNMLALPFKEYANKVSICTRADINQGCSVFYLGKGLYESYKIDGEPELSLLARNAELPTSANDESAYTSKFFESKTYYVDDIVPQKRKKATQGLQRKPFPLQFTKSEKRATGQTLSGIYWSGYTKVRKYGKVDTKEDKEINLYGIFENSEAISFYDGVVKQVDEETGTVVILTNYFIKACDSDKGEHKCFSRPLYQETRNLETIEVSAKQNVAMSQKIGSSTEEHPEFTRFYIAPTEGQITISPDIAYDFATPQNELEDKKKDSPAQEEQEEADVPPGEPVARIGTTGNSTGPHLHAEWSDKRSISPDDVFKYVRFETQPTFTSGYLDPKRPRPHRGVDLAAPEGTPIYLQGGASGGEVLASGCVNGDLGCGVGFGNSITINTPEGEMVLAHLMPESISPNISNMQTTGAGKRRANVTSAPAIRGINIETEFKGVPRALRMIPGRTFLSFVTNYDEWIKNNKPSSIDPGVWIPEDFRSWYLEKVTYEWEKGDLRIKLGGVSGWGAQALDVPKFSEYLATINQAKGIGMSDYYDYIRSPGDLCYFDKEGNNLCETRCAEAQEFIRASRQGRSPEGTTGAGAGSVTGFPTAGCEYTGSQYPQDRVQKIINAAYSLGIKTNIGLAAVVGNAIQESTTQLDPTIPGDNGEAIGIFQWNGPRNQALQNYARGKGADYKNIDVQMSWFVKEASESYPGLASAVNNAPTLGDATNQFERIYERAGDPRLERRIAYANDILSEMKCSK